MFWNITLTHLLSVGPTPLHSIRRVFLFLTV